MFTSLNAGFIFTFLILSFLYQNSHVYKQLVSIKAFRSMENTVLAGHTAAPSGEMFPNVDMWVGLSTIGVIPRVTLVQNSGLEPLVKII